MAAPSVQERALQALRLHYHELEGSLLYLDAGSAEAVATGIGLAALQDDLGAALVCDLSAAAPTDLPTAQLLSGSAPLRRVVLLLTTLLGEAESAVLAACEHCSAAAQFTVLCAVSEAAHHEEAPAAYPPACYAAVAATWQQRLNEQRLPAGLGPCSLVIRHLPLLLCPLTNSAFVLPAASAAARLPRAGQFAAGYSTSAAAAAENSDEDQPHLSAQAAQPAKGAAGRGSGRGSGSGSRGASGAPAAGLALLAHALVDAAATLGYRPEAFSLGPCSRLVCDAMSFVPAASGADLAPAALVLVDRLLDPVSPAQHADLLLQRMCDQFCSSAAAGSSGGGNRSSGFGGGSSTGGGSCAPPFAPLPGMVPMPSLDAAAEPGASMKASNDGFRGPLSLLPGSLRHPDDLQAERWLEFLLSRKGRDAPMFLRKWLREAARKENVPQVRSFKPGSISAAELRSLADSLRRQSPAAAYRHAPLLQLAEAAAAALEGPHAESWEAVQREQRQLLFACTESADAAASQLVDLCALLARSGGSGSSKGSSGGSGGGLAEGGSAPLLGLDDLVLLMLAAYCLLPDFLPWFAAGSGASGGPFSPQQEQQLEAALVEAGSDGGSDSGSGSGGGSQAQAAAEAELRGLQLEARDAVQALLGRMRELSAFRRSLLTAQQGQQLGRLAALGQDGAPRPTPLLRQLVECILRDEPLPDLHAGATSLSGLLRSGLGRLGVKAGPKPSDRPTVVLFVLGGVSLAELHEIQQAIDERAARVSSSGGGSGTSGPQGGGSAPPRIIVGGTALLHPRDL
ncbi:hypothetical protein COHA_001130 [Chlorella ohadii]|uniref:Uncharacterized protein n=1 Tax=Chlorella ohadii TaxID=2649997 RepID=A0AAD5H9K6_9CHLO|nr:hypothetical protein COHA_001130 [Chlorella ohadii]